MEHNNIANVSPSPLDRFLRIFGDVRAGEGRLIILMFLNVYFLLMAYYILKLRPDPVPHG